MNISRKEFLRKSLFSLGEVVGTAAGILTPPAVVEAGNDAELDFIPAARDDLVAVAHNEYCLARGCGCFSCIERCAPEAIKLIPGAGIGINQQLCNGCGSCEYFCPVTPKAVSLIMRQTE